MVQLPFLSRFRPVQRPVVIQPTAAEAVTLSVKDLLDLNLIATRHRGWKLSFHPCEKANVMVITTITGRTKAANVIEGRIILPSHSLQAAARFTLVNEYGSDQSVAVAMAWDLTAPEPTLPFRLLWSIENQVRLASKTRLSGSIQISPPIEPYRKLLDSHNYNVEILPLMEGYQVNFDRKFPLQPTGILFKHIDQPATSLISSGALGSY